jgi:putative endonuclease
MALYVYILCKEPYGTLYVGVTNDLLRRVTEHREGLAPGFTKRYAIRRLVYFEAHDDYHEALSREKRLKRWLRKWKYALVERENPLWEDLYPRLLG